MAGIFNWALEGLRKLNRAGRFIVPDTSRELLEDYRRDADPARAFLLENYTYSPNGPGENTSELYARYKDFCQENGYRGMNERNFGRDVRRIFPETERKRMGPRDDRQYVYDGLMAVHGGPVSQVSQVISS